MSEADLHSAPSTSEKDGELDVVSPTSNSDGADVEPSADEAPDSASAPDEPIGNGHDESTSDATPVAATEPEPEAEPEVAAPEPEKAAPLPKTTSKPTIATRTAAGAKTASATVKKVLNSGTFGAGSAKPAPTKPTPATAASAAARKPGVPPARPTPAARASVGLNASVRRPPGASADAPTKPAAAPRPSTATVKSAAPASATVTPASATRASPSPARPRASVSVEGVKRAPLAGRASIGGGATKPPVTKPPAAKPRTASSISSIREVKEDPAHAQALIDLQGKLKEATDSLTSKSDQVASLESKLSDANSALAQAQADVEATSAAVAELEKSKAATEAQLQEAQASLDRISSEHGDSSSALEALKEELAAAKAASQQSTAAVDALNAQIGEMEAMVSQSKDALQSLKDSHSSAAAEAAQAAAVEHDALIKAQADFGTIQAETEALKATHSKSLAEALDRISHLESQSGGLAELEEQIAALQKEKEDGATKVSELEIEILELRETQEAAEDEHDKAVAELKATQQELAAAKAATEEALKAAEAKEAELLSSAEGAKSEHADALKLAAEEQAKVVAQLSALTADLEAAHAAHETTKNDATAAAGSHASALDEAEQRYLAKQKEFSDELQNITAELESQESKYNAKVDAVKAEHDKLLQEAFERAKSEASEAHGEDLNAFRLNFDSTTAQMTKSHTSALEDLKSDHQAALEEQSKGFEKQISKLTLELKATQDDLAKSKAAYEAAKAEIESLTSQRDDARAAADAKPTASPEQTEEIDRLKMELAHTKDDLSASNEVLALTKDSITEMSNKHSQELEEAAHGRADEVTKLRNAHDEEIGAFAKQKTDLQIRLSDLEGELATAKAALEAASEPAVPKSNGTPAPPQSPGVSREELTKLHEAHNLKLHDIAADHDKAIKALEARLEASEASAAEAQAQIERKNMEIELMETDQEESGEQIKALKEDLERMQEMFKARE